MSGTSRLFVVIGVLAFALIAAQQVPRLIPSDFEFEDISSQPGYRLLVRGEVSQAIDPFVGLGLGDAPLPESIQNWAAENTCSALFQDPANKAGESAVRIAYFTDVQCPYCRILSGTLSDLAHDTDPTVQLSLREFPLFGQWSEVTAAASLAAGRQGAHLLFHERLMSAPLRPSKAAIEAIVADLNLDSERFWSDFDSPGLRQELARHRAIGDLFGIYGTPALVVGRTLAIGNISTEDLDRLIEIELGEKDLDPCGDHRPD